jgi:hypothetical protein
MALDMTNLLNQEFLSYYKHYENRKAFCKDAKGMNLIENDSTKFVNLKI